MSPPPALSPADVGAASTLVSAGFVVDSSWVGLVGGISKNDLSGPPNFRYGRGDQGQNRGKNKHPDASPMFGVASRRRKTTCSMHERPSPSWAWPCPWVAAAGAGQPGSIGRAD